MYTLAYIEATVPKLLSTVYSVYTDVYTLFLFLLLPPFLRMFSHGNTTCNSIQVQMGTATAVLLPNALVALVRWICPFGTEFHRKEIWRRYILRREKNKLSNGQRSDVSFYTAKRLLLRPLFFFFFFLHLLQLAFHSFFSPRRNCIVSSLFGVLKAL